MSASPPFNAAAAQVIAPDEYCVLLEKLLRTGTGYAKTTGEETDDTRICMKVDKNITIPVMWGDFVINAGGALAMRESDALTVAEALLSIRQGTITAEDALFTRDAQGKTVARFDVYGMDGSFLEGKLAPVALGDNGRQASRIFDVRDMASEMADTFRNGSSRDIRVRPLHLKKGGIS